MEILRVFNNNVILARDELGREAVLTGRGLGFQRRPGQDVDASLVARRYVLAQNAESVGEVMAAIPLERIALIERTFRAAARDLGTAVPSSTIVAVVDHVNQAMERVQAGTVMDYPLRAEAAHLHPEELRLAERMVAELNRAQEVQLPDGEAVALALHLFAAAVGAPSTREAARQSRLIGQVMDILKAAYGDDFRPDSIDAARFAVHLRYFLVRARTGEQLADGTGTVIAESLRRRHPRAYQVAVRVKELLEVRLGIAVREDETAYLTIHVARLENGIDRSRPHPGNNRM
ncbi:MULTISPECIES: PRD domain-containing protein [unclassified Actinomyces]|uniref:PRD domain-containing protein n=1 Tax=unclassified Actinomyces TaxID=2609248 RepID=UPI0013743C99|nr:PRD domain-containing protein [Actinomyces sp. 432]NDR54075.1 PRD domain-containing protein [Actinomyces sp. 565]QHO90858.1 sugar transporter [Actinomyces sp. 432]